MIKYIDERCKEWARAVAGGSTGGRSALARMMDGELARSTGGTCFIDDSVMAVEKIVLALESDLKAVVMQQYLGKGNSTENAQALRMSKKKFYQLLDSAHITIDRELNETN